MVATKWAYGFIAVLVLVGGLILRRLYVGEPSASEFATVTTAKLFDQEVSPEEFVSEIDLSLVAGELSRSFWSPHVPILKGTWILETPKRKWIRVSYYGAFFMVEGVSGSFAVMADDRPAFEAFFERLSTEVVIPWRLKKIAAASGVAALPRDRNSNENVVASF